jgi:hypothetical protein
MRLLADESCDFQLVRALRDSGHDVLAVAEISPRAEDSAVVDLAVRDGRLLLTEDKDFGRIVFADQRASGGFSCCASRLALGAKRLTPSFPSSKPRGRN